MEPIVTYRSTWARWALRAITWIAPNLLTVGAVSAQDPDSLWGEFEDVPAAVQAIRSPDPSVRQKALVLLHTLGPEEWGVEGDDEPYNSVVAAIRIALDDADPSVRLAAVRALSQDDAYPLLRFVNDPDESVRSSAIEALGRVLGNEQRTFEEREIVKNALLRALKDRSWEVRSTAAISLGSSGSGDQEIVDSLAAAISDPHPNVRLEAIYAIENQTLLTIDGRIVLSDVLADPDPVVRLAAAIVLSKKNGVNPDVVRIIVEAVKHSNDHKLRVRAIEALHGIPVSESIVAALVAAMRDGDPAVRVAAINQLVSTRSPQLAVPALAEALRDPASEVKVNAANALAFMGVSAHRAIPALTLALNDVSVAPAWTLAPNDVRVSTSAARTLGVIGETLQDSADKLSYSVLKSVLPALEEAARVLSSIDTASGQPEMERELLRTPTASVHRSVQHLSAEIETRYVARAMSWVRTHWYVSSIIVYVLGCLLLWSTLYWIAPLRLLTITDALRPVAEITAPAWLGGVNVPVHFALLLSHFHYRPRVLDAWVKSHIGVARERFQSKSTVHARSIHVPVPAIMDGSVLPTVTASDIRSTFCHRRGCVLVWGEGGAGKTSLACQIGSWAMSDRLENRLCDHLMLPVLIEEDLSSHLAEDQRFVESIRGQLGDLIAVSDPISPGLLSQLLRQRRILVIVDHFSEMSEASRKQIQLSHPEFAVNAIVVTSRVEESLGQVNRTSIRPLRIEGNRLSSFMEAYLVRRGVRGLFDDSEFFAACARLSAIVKDRSITVLLAKLYADEIVRSKQGVDRSSLPESVPDLMRGYVTELNRSVEDGRIPDREVQRDAGIVAWECLQATLRPAPAWRSAVVGSLKGADAEARLKYLENRLHLVETVGAAGDRIRFGLDPLAEYLAGQYLVEQFASDEIHWRNFLERLDSISEASAVPEGFVLGLRDCCRAGVEGIQTPVWVTEELSRRVSTRTTAEPVAIQQAAGSSLATA